jgi:glycerol-3-phosphate O-acyltransferase
MQHINESCAVNAINLIATALLAAPNQAMDEDELVRTLSFYGKVIKYLNYSDRVTLTPYEPLSQIHHAEALGMVHRRKHEMGDFIYLDKAHAIMLTYYRNNILHLLVVPSIIACSFNNSATISRDSIKRYIKVAYPFLQAEFFLPWPSSELEQVIDQILNCLNSADLITHHEVADSFTRPPIGTEQQAQLMILAKVVSPVLELYYMIFALIAEHGSDSITRKRLEELCYLMAQRLSLMYEINSPDFFDKRLITNFINSLIKLGYVSINDSDKLELSEYALKEGRFARRLLDKNMQYNILQMLRTATSHK